MRALVARGCEVYALCPDGEFSGRFARFGVRHISYRINRSSLNPFREPVVIGVLARRLRQLAPDLLHSFMMKPNIYGGIAGRLAGVPRKVASVTGLGSFYIKTPAGVIPRLSRWGLDRLYRTALGRMDKVIFYNQDDRAEFLGLGICGERQSVIIPGSGVDTDYFVPSARDKNGDPVVVTMAARLLRDKGVHEFLAAAEALKGRWGHRVCFQIAGAEDPGNLWSADQALLEGSASQGIIRRLGFLEDIRGVLSGTDIYALPSYREGMPVSVLEAMSMALPVVATNAPGCRETVLDGVNGFQVPVRDAQALAEAIERLVRDPVLRRQFGAAGRRRAEQMFSIGKIVEAHLAIYRELLPGSGI